MMKCIYFLMFLAVSQAYVTGERREAENIPAPKLTRITLVDNPSFAFKVDWTKVTASGSHSIEGYKLRVWEQPKDNNNRYESSSSKSSEESSTHKPRDILVKGVENTSAQVDNIESGVTYEIRVLAYTKNGDGPLSQAMKIQVTPKEDESSQRYLYTVD